MNTHILIIEDCEEDYVILQRAFSKCSIRESLIRFADGKQAADYLLQLEREQQPDRYPAFILLDLNLPDMDGQSFLKWIKQRPELKKIPVLVLTSSGNLQDIHECYASGANSYLRKPQRFNDYLGVVQRLNQFWLGLSKLPFKPEPFA